MNRHTVIVSSYNRPVMLRQALDSVFDAEYPDLEVIVADDGSLPEVAMAADEYDVKWIDFSDDKTANIFRYAIGINRAIKISKGDIIHYLADDDMFSKDRFIIADELLSKNEVMVGYGKLVYWSGLYDPREANYERYRFPEADISPQNPHPYTGLLNHNQVFHRRDCLNNVPEWRLKNSPVDCWFFHDLSKHFRFFSTPYIVAYKRSHKFNLMNLKEQGGGLKE